LRNGLTQQPSPFLQSALDDFRREARNRLDAQQQRANVVLALFRFPNGVSGNRMSADGRRKTHHYPGGVVVDQDLIMPAVVRVDSREGQHPF